MSTRDDDIAPIESLAMQINDKYVFKTTGAWKMVNDKMGGTYVNYAFLTHDKTEIISMEGYVYAPNFKKSKLIREVEAILYSLFSNYAISCKRMCFSIDNLFISDLIKLASS